MPTHPYVIKRFTNNDILLAATCYAKVFSGAPWHEDWHPDRVYERLEHITHSLGFLGMSAWHKNTLIGCGMGNIEPFNHTTYFYLKELFVCNTAQNQGVGSILLDNITKELQTVRVDHIYVITQRHQQLNHFYTKNGFSNTVNTQVLEKQINKKHK